ncbi:hypothetical protein R6231_14255 [Bacillus cytotoxicus]|uniref:hypothetical protein n=1 Tax=Bacillus cereus group TaxID=86661 RepID=UPI000B978D26|nr:MULTISPECIES: hypothetical protein [Bacillus cereus group]AWC30964.1 hypothetical protein CG483_022355 [Bacillus cytotoxicus]AWC35085.1 hypothetical protein CG482_022800 [Bacillus cytotoxicus]AWC39051.1 hypothetical protein CG481_022390 [Bacillus cytotoxicus]AWC43056.1 hypothetical protein CG480_022190 [Bacillus cytotoxicus]AWC46954.1 hypothetical protein CG479_021340 [Bacillus cytotoxicus]
MDNFEVVIAIQQKANQEVFEKIGLNLERHWEEYEIQLSEDNRVVEDILPNMRLNLGELATVVSRYGTEQEQKDIDEIENYLEPYYQADLIKTEFYETPIVKISTDRQHNLKVECISEYVKDSDINFDFNNSVVRTLNHINHSITEAHRNVMDGDVEYQGLYPVDENEVIYCEKTGKPLEQDEEVFYKEGKGYIVPEKVDPKDIKNGNVYFTTIGYEDVEEKRIAPIQYIEEKTYQDGDIHFNPLDGISNDYEDETEVYRMESTKTVGSVKKGYGAMQLKEAKSNPSAGKRYIGKDTVHHEEHAHVSQDREQARKQYMMRQMGGRDY